ncbi:MAG: NADH-quinone oxidoreductase subunit J [Chloroflexota bacterium]|jgi:NADH-quinone oxidoreductase subunit J
MPVLFGFAAIIAIVATVLAISRSIVMHALLYLIVSLLATAVAIFALGAEFLAALEVIIYAGAIMVLFVFVTMMLNLGDAAQRQEQAWQPGRGWIGPGILAGLLFGEFIWIVAEGGLGSHVYRIAPKAVGTLLMSDYVAGVELASMLLLAGIVAAYHVGAGLLAKQKEPEAVRAKAGTVGTK